MDPRYAIALIFFSYTLNMYMKRMGAMMNPSTTKINCLRYDLSLRTPIEDFAYWVVHRTEPILNAGNIQPYVYSEGSECRSMVQTIMAAYQDRPLTKQIFAVVFGLKPEFKIVVSEKMPRQVDGAQYLQETDTLVIGHYMADFFPRKTISSMRAHNILRNKFMHIFINLYIHHFGEGIWTPHFCEKALAQLEEVKIRLKKLLIETETRNINQKIQVEGPLSNDLYDIGDFATRINLIQSSLNKHVTSSEVEQVKLIFAHLVQYFSEEIIAEFFPLYYEQITAMVARFEHMTLRPHPAVFLEPNPDYGYLIQNAECLVMGRDLNTIEIKDLGVKVNDAIAKSDEIYIKKQISQFENQDWKCAVNRLKEKHPKAYGRMHLIMGKCYHFAGEHQDAYKHFSKAWHQKVDFSDAEVKAHFESANRVGRVEGSLRRAYNATDDNTTDDTIQYRYKQ